MSNVTQAYTKVSISMAVTVKWRMMGLAWERKGQGHSQIYKALVNDLSTINKVISYDL